jgi:hypothetical protein
MFEVHITCNRTTEPHVPPWRDTLTWDDLWVIPDKNKKSVSPWANTQEFQVEGNSKFKKLPIS